MPYWCRNVFCQRSKYSTSNMNDAMLHKIILPTCSFAHTFSPAHCSLFLLFTDYRLPCQKPNDAVSAHLRNQLEYCVKKKNMKWKSMFCLPCANTTFCLFQPNSELHNSWKQGPRYTQIESHKALGTTITQPKKDSNFYTFFQNAYNISCHIKNNNLICA